MTDVPSPSDTILTNQEVDQSEVNKTPLARIGGGERRHKLTMPLDNVDTTPEEEIYDDKECCDEPDVMLEHDLESGEIAMNQEFLEKLLLAVSGLDADAIKLVCDAICDVNTEDRTLDLEDIKSINDALCNSEEEFDSEESEEIESDEDMIEAYKRLVRGV